MPRFELPAVDLDSFGHVINSPARFERVQRVAKPLKIGVGRLWDDIDIHRLEGDSLEQTSEAAKHDEINTLNVEGLA
jgi:hypothetical protein